MFPPVGSNCQGRQERAAVHLREGSNTNDRQILLGVIDGRWRNMTQPPCWIVFSIVKTCPPIVRLKDSLLHVPHHLHVMPDGVVSPCKLAIRYKSHYKPQRREIQQRLRLRAFALTQAYLTILVDSYSYICRRDNLASVIQNHHPLFRMGLASRALTLGWCSLMMVR